MAQAIPNSKPPLLRILKYHSMTQTFWTQLTFSQWQGCVNLKPLHCPHCPHNFQRQTFLGEKMTLRRHIFGIFFAFQLEKEEWWHGISTTMVSVEVAIKCCHGRFLSVSGFQKERRHAQISINITPHKRSRFCAPLKWCVHNFKDAIILKNHFFVSPYPGIPFDTSLRTTILKQSIQWKIKVQSRPMMVEGSGACERRPRLW